MDTRIRVNNAAFLSDRNCCQHIISYKKMLVINLQKHIILRTKNEYLKKRISKKEIYQ